MSNVVINNSISSKTGVRKLSMPKPKRWSHQNELDSNIGKKVKLAFLNREGVVIGKLIAADQFTVKIEIRRDPIINKGDIQNMIFFKQAVEYFEFEGV